MRIKSLFFASILASTLLSTSACGDASFFSKKNKQASNDEAVATASATSMPTATEIEDAMTTDKPIFNDKQTKAIQKIMHDYLVANPEIIITLTQKLQQRELQKQQARAQQAITQHADRLFDTKTSPISGNKAGKITVVEFFDYQCGHCRRMQGSIKQIVKEHKDVRVIHKAYPIFGKESVFAAKIALAAKHQSKFDKFHDALMKAKPPLNEKRVLEIAKQAGLNVDRLKKDMTSKSVEDELKQNYMLASKLGIIGTPTFVISNPELAADAQNQQGKKAFYLPGAVDLENLQEIIEQFKK